MRLSAIKVFCVALLTASAVGCGNGEVPNAGASAQPAYRQTVIRHPKTGAEVTVIHSR